jgi:hypothetical protein
MKVTRLFVIAACVWFMTAMCIAQELSYIAVDEQVCGKEQLARQFGDALLAISCRVQGAITTMHIAVLNFAPSSAGRLRAFDVGFCTDSVISARAQSGWQVIAGGRRVEWRLPDHLVADLGIEPRSRVGGFEIDLRPGWNMSMSSGGTWEQTAAGTAMTRLPLR